MKMIKDNFKKKIIVEFGYLYLTGIPIHLPYQNKSKKGSNGTKNSPFEVTFKNKSKEHNATFHLSIVLPISSLHLLTRSSKNPRALLENQWFSKSYTLWFFVKEPELFIGVGAKCVFEFLKKKDYSWIGAWLKVRQIQGQGLFFDEMIFTSDIHI